MDIIDKIKNHSLLLAPMAGVTDSAFRQVCQHFGADIVYTEMISAKALTYGDRRTHEMLKTAPSESPIIVQLFGHQPDIVAEAAKIVQDYGVFSAIDINMGCPAPKIVNNGDGCALMNDPRTACAIIEKTTAAVSLPVTAKFRAGFDISSQNAVSFAHALYLSGAKALCIHGRLRSQFYAPPVDIDVIAQVVESVPIPVIANGDVSSPVSYTDMCAKTNCSSVMIGRGALGNPFLFSAIRHFEKNGTTPPPTAWQEKLDTALWHIELMCQNKGEKIAIREARKHMAWYLKGIRGAASLRAQTNCLDSLADLRALVEKAISLEKEDINGDRHTKT